MDNLTWRSPIFTQRAHPEREKPPQRRRRPSFSWRANSVEPPKDRKKFVDQDSQPNAHEEYATAYPPPSPAVEIDGTPVFFDSQKVMTSDIRNIVGSHSKQSSPTTPTSLQTKLRGSRPSLNQPENIPTDQHAYRIGPSSDGPRLSSQSQPSSASSNRSRNTNDESTPRSSSTTVESTYFHELQAPEQAPDSPTILPHANIKFNAPSSVTQGPGGSRNGGTGLPLMHSNWGHHGQTPQSADPTDRRQSSVASSSRIGGSPNPFTGRDLTGALRELVLDQGLVVRLEDGTQIEMGADDVQAAKDILNAWNIYEGSLGGGISHGKAYLCMQSSRLPKELLAEIWDSCQTIVDPPMPLRLDYSLFPEEFIIATHLIQRELQVDMDTLQHLLTMKSPSALQQKSVTNKILINGHSVACPSDVQGILRLFGIPEGGIPPQAVLNRCLYIAASKGFRPAVATFLDWRAEIEAVNTICNRRAIHAACENGHEDSVRILLQRGASVNVKDEDGKTPLHLAAADGSEGIVRMLIQSGANVNAFDDEGDSPLHLAADNGRSNVAALLLRARVKVDICGAGKRSALIRAVSNSHKVTARCLLDEGANIDHRDEMGWTALHYAVRNGNETLTRILLEEGAKIHERTYDEHNAICLAVQYDMKTLVRFLVENGAAINGYGANGMAPIHIAAMMGKEKILSMLLQLGASVNKYTKGSAINSQTALMVAIIQQHEGTIKILLNSPDIDLEAEDRNRSTALHYAAQKGNLYITRLLLEKGPRLEDMNMDGKAPIDLAKDKDVKDLLKAAVKTARLPRKFSI
ncbi:hypothetical protein DRE_06632 [Drechslerella stenobrocha 248]|uniref:Uncharacterized protein n=1 Tax=Drechslerella stenobrocha 248 TaxID=1043628 RepID=W7HXJ7_9PEZI|nr:hypothetical protein DRE_06632 [Drechslerella stenobrocha 248]